MVFAHVSALRKHAYSNIFYKHAYSNTISPPKTENFQTKNPDIFHISARNIDRGYSLEPPRGGGSNEYPQSMLLSRNMKNSVYSCKPQFYYFKTWALRGSKLYMYVFMMGTPRRNFIQTCDLAKMPGMRTESLI